MVYLPRTRGELEDAISALAFSSLTIVRPGFIGGDRVEHCQIERIITPLLKIADPVLPVAALISPAATRAAIMVEAAVQRAAGRHNIDSSQIALAAAGAR